jgi:transporter family-2 protein
MYSVFAPLVGALMTVMNQTNSRFSVLVGSLVATLVIHIAGLAAVSAVLLAKREEKRRERPPLYYYLGGFVGVGTVFSNNYAFAALGASLAVALALLGQTLFSIAVDATGLLGRRKYPLSLRSLPGICLALAGVAVMVGAWRSNALAMLVAFASGALPSLSFILNSELGLKKGVFRSTRVNYLVGLATTLALVGAIRPPMVPAARAIAEAGPLLALGGGFMGVAVVSAMNSLFPRMPAFSAAILLFCGQALAGLVIDFASAGAFDARKLVGTLVLLAGLAVNALLARRREGGKASSLSK